MPPVEDNQPARRSNLIDVGRIGGAFGVKGWVKVRSFTEPEENIVTYSPWWLKTRHGVKAVKVDEYQYRPQGLVARLNGVDNREDAAALAKTLIAVDRQQLPDLEEGEYYWHQLVGLAVTTEVDGRPQRLGTVARLLETGANDVLVVKPDSDSIDQRERLVPYVPGIYVREVTPETEAIVVDWDPAF